MAAPTAEELRAGTLYLLASAAGFGTLAVLAKVAYGMGLNTPTILFHRFLFASVILAAALLAGTARGRRRLTGLSRRALLVGGLMGVVGYTGQSFLFFTSVDRVGASLAGLLLYTYPAFVTLLVWLLFGERATRRVVGALALASAGVLLLLRPGAAALDAGGVAAGLGAALVYSGYILVGQTALRDVSPRALSLVVMVGAALSYTVIGAATGTLAPRLAPGAYLVVLAIALLATVLPILTFFEGLQRVGPSRAAILSTVEPVVTVALGAALLGERLTPVQGVGAAMLLAGVLVLQRRVVG